MQDAAHISEINGRRAGSKYYHRNDGFYFFINSSDSNRAYLKCVDYRNCACTASMPLKPEDRVATDFFVHGVHSHDSDPNLEFELQLRQRILQRCSEEPTEPRIIFDEECAR